MLAHPAKDMILQDTMPHLWMDPRQHGADTEKVAIPQSPDPLIISNNFN